MAALSIAGRSIGPGHPPYVIAEVSANHLGRLDRARAIMEAARRAGADAVKLQTYRADSMTLDAESPGFRIEGGLWDGASLHRLYTEAATPWDWHEELFAFGRRLGIPVFSSPFDDAAVELLEGLGAPAYKIASFELVDLELIARVAATGKPVILSTGMASLEEIAEALDAARAAGARELALLHCVSGYPTPPEEAHLHMLGLLRDRFGVPVGLSDHSAGHLVATAATALGACIVEKHLTLARADGGPDAAFSMEPHEFGALVTACRTGWAALGGAGPDRSPSERASLAFRRSLYAVRDIGEGEMLTRDNVRAIRPGLGLKPRELPEVLGRVARQPVPRGTPLSWELISREPPRPGRPSRVRRHHEDSGAGAGDGPVVAVVQARMTSTRLPGKVLLPLAGAPLLLRLLERVQRAAGIDLVCVAAPEGPEHDPIAAALAGRPDVALVRGSERDVLGRTLLAARSTGAGTIVRITADCPMIDAGVVAAAVALRRSTGLAYARTGFERGFPRGFDVEVITTAALAAAAAEAADPYEREHVTPFLWRRPDRFPAAILEHEPDRRFWRLVVDTPEDYRLAVEVYDELYPRCPEFGYTDLVRLFDRRPELLSINHEVAQTPYVWEAVQV